MGTLSRRVNWCPRYRLCSRRGTRIDSGRPRGIWACTAQSAYYVIVHYTTYSICTVYSTYIQTDSIVTQRQASKRHDYDYDYDYDYHAYYLALRLTTAEAGCEHGRAWSFCRHRRPSRSASPLPAVPPRGPTCPSAYATQPASAPSPSKFCDRTGQGRTGQDRTGQDSTHAYALALLHPPRNKSTWPLLAAQAAAMPRYQDPLPPRSSSPPPITPIHAPFLHTRASPLHPSVAAHAPLPCPKLPSPSPSPLPYSASPVPVVPGALSQIASDRCAQADYPAIALHTCCFHPWALERSCLTKPGLHASATRIMPL